MTVVVTVLLAVVGVMFVMSARVDKIATSYITENRELYAAADVVIEEISRQLVEDVPDDAGQEYFDYPGDADKWLANLEPYLNGPNDYRWKHITDLYDNFADACNVQVEIVPDSKIIDLDDPNDEYSRLRDEPADADGDGVADSKWIRLNDIVTSKGRPIFAAIRVIDNGGMLNVNTAYKFDPNATEPNEIDGSSLMQIDLLTLSERGSTSNPLGELNDARFGYEPHIFDNYVENVIWHYDEPDRRYTPFDISDELKLRYRYILNYRPVITRIEELWEKVYDWGLGVPRDSGSQLRDEWFYYANYYDLSDPNNAETYDYRHISTTYNMDRIIQPDGLSKMVNINDRTISVDSLYSAIRSGLYDANSNFVDANDVAAQIAVNLIDFRDSDSEVTVFEPNDPCLPAGRTYYGFERPCVYISELAHHFKTVTMPGGTGPEPGIPYMTYRSYAIELHKPYLADSYPEPNQWRLSMPSYSEDLVGVEWSGTERFHVIYFEDPCVPLDVDFDDPNFAGSEQEPPFKRYSKVFKGNDLVELQRRVVDSNDDITWVTVDSVEVPEVESVSGWLDSDPNGIMRSIQRNITLHKCVSRLWAPAVQATNEPDLGQFNAYTTGGTNFIQARPYLEPSVHPDGKFTNVGEIGLIFRKGAYYEDVADRDDAIGYSSTTDEEAEVRVDLANSDFQNILNHLTVLDPSRDEINNDGDWKVVNNKRVEIIDEDALAETPEWKIPGRININTAPWFVLAQLPWMTYDETNLFGRAQAICSYRDILGAYSGRVGEEGFRNIGELMDVPEMRGLDSDGKNNLNTDTPKGPDLTPDSAQDDFEERDLIFTRLSNLVTVRSDVFTAYILVRIGADGPQKRVIAILDRSGVYSADGKVKIVAWHPVPDPR